MKKERFFFPLEEYDHAGSTDDRILGEELICSGKVGCVILAGGEGTRLGFNDPKALFPISIVKKKSLLQLVCEKTRAASKKAERKLPLAIMTSDSSYRQIESFLQNNHFFDLSIDLFMQEMAPILDDKGQPVLQNDTLIQAPSGNGSFFKSFFTSPIWKKWQDAGVLYVTIVPIDNPLGDPFDATLIGYHARKQAEATVKAFLRENGEDQVGLIVKENNRTCVVEYSEIAEKERAMQNDDGSLKFNVSNTGLLCFSMDAIARVAKQLLPQHFARKQYKERWIYKCETFIFDAFDFLEHVYVLIYAKEHIFAPLKNATGVASIESVQKALLASDRRVYATISGLPAPNKTFELSQEFYYPTQELLQKWQGKPLPDCDYIEAT